MIWICALFRARRLPGATEQLYLDCPSGDPAVANTSDLKQRAYDFVPVP